MSRSQPGPPGYLWGAIKHVEGVLFEAYPQGLTAAQIAARLREQEFRWPLPSGYYRSGGRTVYRTEGYGDVTPERVRRVCQMRGGRTGIRHARPYGRPQRYTLWEGYYESIKLAKAAGRAAGQAAAEA